MHDQKIINLGTPTDASDAATKDYVDNFNTTLTISGDVGANDAVSLQNDILEFEIENAQKSNEHVENFAREKLNLSYPDEEFISFENEVKVHDE